MNAANLPPRCARHPLAHTPRTAHAATCAAGEVQSNQEWCWLVNVSEDGKTLKKHVQRSVDSQSSEAGKYKTLWVTRL